MQTNLRSNKGPRRTYSQYILPLLLMGYRSEHRIALLSVSYSEGPPVMTRFIIYVREGRGSLLSQHIYQSLFKLFYYIVDICFIIYLFCPSILYRCIIPSMHRSEEILIHVIGELAIIEHYVGSSHLQSHLAPQL